MRNVLAFIIFAVSVLTLAASITLVVGLLSDRSRATEKAANDLTQIITIEDSEFGQDLTGVLSGSTVKGLMEKYNNGGIYVFTVTKGNPTGFYGTDSIWDADSKNYISDGAKLMGSIVRNSVGSIIAVRFVENGVDDVLFNLDKAKQSKTSIETALVKTQYKFFKLVQENASLCLESVSAYKDWAEKLVRLHEAEMDKSYVDAGGDAASSFYDNATLIALARQEEAFYKSLRRTIMEQWIPTNWFEAVLYEDKDFSGTGTTWDSDDGDDWSESSTEEWTTDGDTDDDTSDSDDWGGLADGEDDAVVEDSSDNWVDDGSWEDNDTWDNDDTDWNSDDDDVEIQSPGD